MKINKETLLTISLAFIGGMGSAAVYDLFIRTPKVILVSETPESTAIKAVNALYSLPTVTMERKYSDDNSKYFYKIGKGNNVCDVTVASDKKGDSGSNYKISNINCIKSDQVVTPLTQPMIELQNQLTEKGKEQLENQFKDISKVNASNGFGTNSKGFVAYFGQPVTMQMISASDYAIFYAAKLNSQVVSVRKTDGLDVVEFKLYNNLCEAQLLNDEKLNKEKTNSKDTLPIPSEAVMKYSFQKIKCS